MANNFKVIVVGGGPVGLTAAQALRLAGIDFVVLERREDIFADAGASIGFGPSTLRVLAQFGILETLKTVGAPIERIKSFDMTGYKFADNTSPKESKKNHGAPLMVFHRADLIEALYNGLPPSAKAQILQGKNVVSITSSDTSASVTCSDGTTYTGSIILGADGVHSRTRRLMRSLALTASPTTDWDAEAPYEAEYKCMWCSFPRPGPPGHITDTQGQGRSLMYLSGKELSWMFLYERLPEATTDRPRYTKEDMMAYAEQFEDMPVNETLKVRDVFDIRKAGITDLDEGVVKNLSWGRVVLAGDACHKVTPNAGRGYVTGVQDIVALVNGLRASLQSSPGGSLDNPTLARVFGDYRRTRMAGMVVDISFSRHATRLQAWANTAYYFVARYVMCWAFTHKLIHGFVNGPQTADGLVLDYVPMEEPFAGSMPWKHPMLHLRTKGKGKAVSG